jgi:hypothetical protein
LRWDGGRATRREGRHDRLPIVRKKRFWTMQQLIGADMAKGQKKSNREVRKPKADKPKAVAAAPSFLSPPTKKK